MFFPPPVCAQRQDFLPGWNLHGLGVQDLCHVRHRYGENYTPCGAKWCVNTGLGALRLRAEHPGKHTFQWILWPFLKVGLHEALVHSAAHGRSCSPSFFNFYGRKTEEHWQILANFTLCIRAVFAYSGTQKIFQIIFDLISLSILSWMYVWKKVLISSYDLYSKMKIKRRLLYCRITIQNKQHNYVTSVVTITLRGLMDQWSLLSVC